MDTLYVESGGKIYTREDFEKASMMYDTLQKRLQKATINKDDVIDVEAVFVDKNDSVIKNKKPQAPAEPLKIKDYEAVKVNNQIHYYSAGDTEKRVVFKDLGDKISLSKNSSDADLLAVLQLANSKFEKGFNVKGSDEFKQRCVKLCAEHNLKLANPELQEQFQKLKKELGTDKDDEYPDAFRMRPDAPNSYGEENYDDADTKQYATAKM